MLNIASFGNMNPAAIIHVPFMFIAVPKSIFLPLGEKGCWVVSKGLEGNGRWLFVGINGYERICMCGRSGLVSVPIVTQLSLPPLSLGD